MYNARKKTTTSIPDELWQSLTWDRGKELSDHHRFTIESGMKVYFAVPRSPWQPGANANTNGLLLQYFPKGTDLSRWSAKETQSVANTLNARPRKTLGWMTPTEVLNKRLLCVQQPNVATTGSIHPNWQRFCRSHNLEASMSRRGKCWDLDFDPASGREMNAPPLQARVERKAI